MKNNSQFFRKKILSRLRKFPQFLERDSKENFLTSKKYISKKAKLEKFKSTIEEARAEVHICSEKNWLHILSKIVKEKNIKSMLYGGDTILSQKLLQKSRSASIKMPKLIEYSNPIEESKEQIFEIDSSITTTKGGIADTGTIILWPSINEPRLMSLITPIHIAVLYSNMIYRNFLEVMVKEKWNEKMPTNILLISGPSKTTDIEQTLVYGVHGAKELIILIVE